MSASPTYVDEPDVILIGGGIMSANLAVMLKRLKPSMKLQVFEVSNELAQEASHSGNNAGTGHAGICELSYTPSREADGTVNVARALHIFEQFEHSKQFWSYLVASGIVTKPSDFIRAVPHIGFVHGAENVGFLRSRFEAMAQHHFFHPMEHTTDRETVSGWAPLVMEGRDNAPVAATKMDNGTEVNFGELARRMLQWLGQQEGCGLATGHRVTNLRQVNGAWKVGVRHQASGEKRFQRAKFVFVGAGGGTLPLLQSTALPAVRGLGAFPIGGHWLVCSKPEIASRHNAKVYGMTPKASPSLGAPHLDTRGLGAQRTLLFGPFAAWTGKFLKHTGSHTDLPLSLRSHNVGTLLNAGAHNLDLVRYCIAQGAQTMRDRIEAVREFYPEADPADWQLVDAGIRVQALKKADQGTIYFGTEVFTDSHQSIAALLGASPGASVSVNIAREVILTCFPQLLKESAALSRMKEMLPTYDEDLKPASMGTRFRAVSAKTETILHINPHF